MSLPLPLLSELDLNQVPRVGVYDGLLHRGAFGLVLDLHVLLFLEHSLMELLLVLQELGHVSLLV